MAQINQEVLSKVRSDEALIFKIAQGTNRKFRTVENWVRDNDEMLASAAVVLIISKATGLSEDEILEPERATA